MKNKNIKKIIVIIILAFSFILLLFFLILLLFSGRVNFVYQPYIAQHLSLVFDDQIETAQRLGDVNFLLSDLGEMSAKGKKIAVIGCNSINREKNIKSLTTLINSFYIDIFNRKDLNLDNTTVFNNSFGLDSPFEIRSYLTEKDKLRIFYHPDSKKVDFLFPGQNLQVNEEAMRLNNFIVYSLEDIDSNTLLQIGETVVDLSNYQNDLAIDVHDLIANKIINYQPEEDNLLVSQNYSFEQGLWSQVVADCSADLTGGSELEMNLVDDGNHGSKSLELISNNHSACAFKTFSIALENNKLYKLSFAYKNLAGQKLQYYYNLRNDSGEQQEKLQKIIALDSQWQSADAIITPQMDDIKAIDIYFYAPSDGSQKIINRYDNIVLSSYKVKKEIDAAGLSFPQHYGLSNWFILDQGKNIFKYPSSKKNLLADFNYSFEAKSWTSDAEDCSNYLDGEPEMEMKLSDDAQEGNKSLELSSKNHFACTFKTFPVTLESDKLYKLSFAYRNLAGGVLQYYYNLKNDDENQDSYDVIKTQDTDWKGFRTIVDPKIDGITKFDFYFYAPSDGSKEVINRYDNLRLEEFAPKEIYSYYLYSQNQNTSQEPRVGNIFFKQINKYKTKVILHQAKESLLLVYPNKYSSEWKLYLTKNKDAVESAQIGVVEKNDLADPSFWPAVFKKPLSEDYHFQINNYDNGWFLNIKDLCLDSAYCQKNPDGTYNLTLIIENRWGQIIKLGLVFSIVIIVLCLLFLKFTKHD